MDTQRIVELLDLRLPARLSVRQTADLLAFKEYEIPVLIRGRLLKPLGDPPHNGHKYFATVDILKHSQNVDWLDRASRLVTRHWQGKVAKRRSSLTSA